MFDIGIIHFFSLSELVSGIVDVIGVDLTLLCDLRSGTGQFANQVIVLLLQHNQSLIEFLYALHLLLQLIRQSLNRILKFLDLSEIMRLQSLLVLLKSIAHLLNFLL